MQEGGKDRLFRISKGAEPRIRGRRERKEPRPGRTVRQD